MLSRPMCEKLRSLGFNPYDFLDFDQGLKYMYGFYFIDMENPVFNGYSEVCDNTHIKILYALKGSPLCFCLDFFTNSTQADFNKIDSFYRRYLKTSLTLKFIYKCEEYRDMRQENEHYFQVVDASDNKAVQRWVKCWRTLVSPGTPGMAQNCGEFNVAEFFEGI